MRKLLSMLALAFGLTTVASTADAYSAWGEDLRFVSETQIPGPEGAMSLCHFVDRWDILFVPVYTKVERYVLSTDGCKGEMYRNISAEQFKSFQAVGLIPASLPEEPKASLLSLLWGHAWAFIAGIAVLKTLFLAVTGKGKSRRKTSTDTLALHSLVAMSQVAVADGRIDDAEVRQIANILTRLTGTSYAPTQVMEMLAKLNPSASDLEQIGQNLSEKDRQIVLEAALNIAVADGEIHPNEYAVVSELAQRMRIGGDQFRSALARISAHLQTVHPV